MRMLCCVALLAACGCIGIYRGSDQDVWLSSEPQGANVTVAGQEGVTPCLVRIDRDGDPVKVSYSKPGCAPVEYVVDPRCDAGLLVLEGLFNTLLGCLIDLAAGNAYTWPVALHATLAPEGGVSTVAEHRRAAPPPRSAENDGGYDKDGYRPRRSPSVGSQPF